MSASGSVPGAHAEHVGEPAFENCPAPHGRHVDAEPAPLIDERVPAGHATQSAVKGADQKPAAQHTPAPAGEPSDAPQGKHAELSVLPVVGANVLAGHTLHGAVLLGPDRPRKPVAALHVPTGHGEHVSAAE